MNDNSRKNLNLSSPILLGVGVVLSGLIFVFDVSMPLGVAGGVPYIATVLLGIWLPKWWHTVVFAVLATFLTALGYFLSDPGSELWIVLTNRALAIFAIWATAVLLLMKGRADSRLRKADNELASQESRYRLMVKNIPGAVYHCVFDEHWTVNFSTDYVEKITGYPASDFVGNQARSFASITHPDDEKIVTQAVLDGVESDNLYVIEYRIINRWGKVRWILNQGRVISDKTSQVAHLEGVFFDITERKQAEKGLRRSEVLERLAAGASLREILTAVVVNAEKLSPDSLCSVSLQDEGSKQLRHGAAPSLPDFYNEAINGSEIGSNIGFCVAAAYTGERVIVEDIMNHPNWASYISLAKKAGLRSCWSEPIISSAGDILGTFSCYYRDSRVPSKSDLDFMQDSARLAAIAIERKQSEEKLRKSEKILSAIFEQAAVGVALIESHSGKFLRINKKYSDIIGYSSEEMLSLDFMAITHPDDLQEDLDKMQLLLDGKTHEFSMEKRLFRKDGSIVWVNLTVSPMWKTREQVNRSHCGGRGDY